LNQIHRKFGENADVISDRTLFPVWYPLTNNIFVRVLLGKIMTVRGLVVVVPTCFVCIEVILRLRSTGTLDEPTVLIRRSKVQTEAHRVWFAAAYATTTAICPFGLPAYKCQGPLPMAAYKGQQAVAYLLASTVRQGRAQPSMIASVFISP
jgi:hypothetical protein